jgi:hypothetical protein
VHTYLVRVWLPDRPGALGQVASRIGAVCGDVVGIEILERGAGRAIDELVVALPERGLVDLLVSEISQVDGVDVEDVRPLAADRQDPAVAALATAVRLVEASDPDAVLRVLCEQTRAEFEADWAMALRLDPVGAVVEVGAAPTAGWVAAFVHGSRHLDADRTDGCPEDVAWADLPAGGLALALALGRKGRPFRWRERRQLAALARIADRRLTD